MQRSKFNYRLVLIPESHPTPVPPPPVFESRVAFLHPSSPLGFWSPQTGPSVHTIAVDQNDGQHIILAQHSLCRPALSAQGDLRSCRGHKPSLSAPETAGPTGTAQTNAGRDRDGLGGGQRRA